VTGTTFLLVRHAAHDALGKTLTGRAPGIALSAKGQAQSEALAERLAPVPVAAIYSSPLERAYQTAEPLARRLGLEVKISPQVGEMEFGEWSGLSFEELAPDPRWNNFNLYRSGTPPPGGELMAEVQCRMVRELDRLRHFHPDEAVVMVSHGDVIRAALAYYLGVPLDLFQRIEISPASMSIVRLFEHGPQVLRMNDTGSLQDI
jgi:probable phosphoglycerate mutase